MSELAQTVSEFGRSLQLPDLALNGNGIAAMEIGDFGLLQLESHNHGLLVLLIREIAFLEARHVEKALELCHPRENLRFQPVVALGRRNKLVIGAPFPITQLDVPSMQQAVDTLGELHDRVAGTP